MHDIDLGRWRTQGKGVVIIGCGSSHDVMCSRCSFSQDNAHMGDIGLLDGVNQGLSQAQKFSLFSNISNINTGGILKPDNGDPVSTALGDEFIHLDQALAVKLPANARVGCVFRIVCAQKSLVVSDEAHQ